MSDDHQRAAVAERAARAGGAVAREAYRSELTVETKSSKNDPVTQIDRDAQRQVVSTIHEAFPDDPFVCEEELAPLSGPDAETELTELDAIPESGPVWVIDPIDGTSNFVRGMQPWATSVVSLVDGTPAAAANYLPILGDLYAVGPESVTRDGMVVSVSDRTDPETFTIAPDGWWDRDERAELGRVCTNVAERFGDFRRIGSFQATLAYVAEGAIEGAISTQPMSVWDTVAGVQMVRAAGGTVTDVDGERWTYDSTELVASNGEAHDEILAAVSDAVQ